MYRVVLFDFDGTLTPSLDLWLKAYQYALGTYDRTMAEEIVLQRCFNRNYADVADDLGLPSGAELGVQVQRGIELAYAEAELFPSVADLLVRCKTAGMALGLVTSSFRCQVMTTLDRLGIADYFDTVVSGDDVTHHKPHPEPVEIALTRLGRQPEETLFVGDNAVDVIAGRAAGTATALFMPAAHLRFYDFDVLRATQPDFLFTDHGELVAYLVDRGCFPREVLR